MYIPMTRLTFILIVLTLCAPAVLAAAPVVGTFESPDAGNDFLNGRWFESFAAGQAMMPGNGLSAASWDGATLGSDWILTDAVQVGSAQLLADLVDPAG